MDPRTLSPRETPPLVRGIVGAARLVHDGAPEPARARFAEWQSAMETQATSARDVDEIGRKEFLARFEKDLPDLDGQFRGWVAGL